METLNKRFAIISKEDVKSKEIEHQLLGKLRDKAWIHDQDHPDMVITIGGDGTFLRAIHRYIKHIDRVKFVGIHTGTLGFYTNYNHDELDLFIQDLNQTTHTIQTLPLLGVEVDTLGEKESYFAVNEIRVENVIRTQLMRIYIDHEFMETFRGTGICISTQAGSTAYNRSLGGAILQPGLDFIQITEITGIHHHAYRSLNSPFIVHKEADIKLESDDFQEAILCFDHLSIPLKKDSTLSCGYCSKTIQLLIRPQYTYIQRLKSLF